MNADTASADSEMPASFMIFIISVASLMDRPR
jgi:hypothetical protein